MLRQSKNTVSITTNLRVIHMSKAGGLEFTRLRATFYTVIAANNYVKLSYNSATNFSIWQNRLQRELLMIT